MRRAAVVWLLLFAVYASTLGLHAAGRSDYTGEEPHYLLTAKSLVDDRSPDLRDEYSGRAYRDFYPYALAPHGALTKGRANEPHGVGFPLLIAPAYAIGGAHGVELFLAALAALAVALAYALAQRAGVPDPWALGATLAVGLSPPPLAYSTAVYPQLPAAAVPPRAPRGAPPRRRRGGGAGAGRPPPPPHRLDLHGPARAAALAGREVPGAGGRDRLRGLAGAAARAAAGPGDHERRDRRLQRCAVRRRERRPLRRPDAPPRRGRRPDRH